MLGRSGILPGGFLAAAGDEGAQFGLGPVEVWPVGLIAQLGHDVLGEAVNGQDLSQAMGLGAGAVLLDLGNKPLIDDRRAGGRGTHKGRTRRAGFWGLATDCV